MFVDLACPARLLWAPLRLVVGICVVECVMSDVVVPEAAVTHTDTLQNATECARIDSGRPKPEVENAPSAQAGHCVAAVTSSLL